MEKNHHFLILHEVTVWITDSLLWRLIIELFNRVVATKSVRILEISCLSER